LLNNNDNDNTTLAGTTSREKGKYFAEQTANVGTGIAVVIEATVVTAIAVTITNTVTIAVTITIAVNTIDEIMYQQISGYESIPRR